MIRTHAHVHTLRVCTYMAWNAFTISLRVMHLQHAHMAWNALRVMYLHEVHYTKCISCHAWHVMYKVSLCLRVSACSWHGVRKCAFHVHEHVLTRREIVNAFHACSAHTKCMYMRMRDMYNVSSCMHFVYRRRRSESKKLLWFLWFIVSANFSC